MEPMFSLHKPSAETIESFLNSQSKSGFTYAAVGATATVPPSGYNLDHSRIKLGEGEAVFLAAKAALQDWTQFHLGWVEAKPLESSIRVGGMVAVVAHTVGVWWINACRIIYVVSDDGPLCRYGYACGTMPAHAGSGEERFLVEWNRSDNTVWYDILAFSKPQGFLSHVGYRWLRRLQRRFREQSGVAMLKSVNGQYGQASKA